MHVEIVEFEALTEPQRDQAADVLRRALAHVPSAWPEPGAAEAEVATFFEDEEREAVAAVAGGRLIGWVGWIRAYSHAWELHPLVVDPAHQRGGVGRALVAELERRASAAGMLTVFLGTDDDYGGTNAFGADLLPDLLGKARSIAPANGHAMGFYQRIGYEVAGLLPDVNGAGRPDILMAKRVTPWPGPPV